MLIFFIKIYRKQTKTISGPQLGQSIQISLEPEKFAPVQAQNKKINIVFGGSQSDIGVSSSKTEDNRDQSKFKVYLGNIPVCRLCLRKFRDDYNIEMHEKFSTLHKVNLLNCSKL